MPRRARWGALSLVLAVIVALCGAGCGESQPEKLKMTVLVADSLILPFQEIEKNYEQIHPEIDILSEGHGSIQVVRTVTEIGMEADVALVADSQLIPLLMYDNPLPDGSGTFADWYIQFATNELGIAYRPESRYAAEINAANWYDILSRPDVSLGLSDPLIDSLAYRALMCVWLAQDYYADESIFERFYGSSFKLPLEVENQGEKTVIHVPESMQPETERIRLRSYNLQIISLLESGDVDYGFEYRSVARQHGLQFLELPAPINLGDPAWLANYQRVSVKLDFQRFASVMPEFTGQRIVYAATIPANAPHPLQAVDYLAFVLGEEGQKVLQSNSQPPLFPALADHPEKVPNHLAELVR